MGGYHLRKDQYCLFLESVTDTGLVKRSDALGSQIGLARRPAFGHPLVAAPQNVRVKRRSHIGPNHRSTGLLTWVLDPF